MVLKIINFIKNDIWKIRLEDLPRKKSFFIRQLRIILLSSRGFREDKCSLRASALTFYSLLSIVPVVAMAFGVAKGFGFEKILEKQLLEKFPGQEEVFMKVIDFAHSLLEETKGGMVAGIGVAFLFWIVIRLLSNIERSFNVIWKIKTPRSIGRKLSDYLSVMLICPVLVIMSSSITVFIVTQFKIMAERYAFLGVFNPFVFFSIKLIPYCVICGAFVFIYFFMPNTRVTLKPGLLAGIFAGIVYQIAQWGYISFQVMVVQHNAIYGSFAALPLFLIWLQLSWLIVLFGAEVSFAIQNVNTYEFGPDCLKVSPSFKKLLSLRTTHLLIKNFSNGQKSLTDSQISHTLGIPIRLVREILNELVESKIASEINIKENIESAYQPARDINILTTNFVIDTLEKSGVDNIPVAHTKELDILSETLKEFGNTIEKSPANKLLKDI